MSTTRWMMIVGLTLSLATACGARDGFTARLPRNVRESAHRDFPEQCRGRGIRGRELGGGRFEIVCQDAAVHVVYACPGSRWGSCVVEQTSGGMVAIGPQPQQPVLVQVTGGVAMQPGTTVQVTSAPSYTTDGTGQPVAQAAVQPTAQPAGPAPTMAQIEAGIHGWIDSNRAAILACTQTPAALVDVSWTAQGVPAVALGGEMHGTAGEPCVQQTLANVVFSVGGQAGAIRHVVQ